MQSVVVVPYLGAIPTTYFIGCFGSIAVEIGAALKASVDLDGRCPERYLRPFYIIIRVLMILVAGAIPAFLDAANSLTALYMGASAPLFLDRLGRGVDAAQVLKEPSTGT